MQVVFGWLSLVVVNECRRPKHKLRVSRAEVKCRCDGNQHKLVENITIVHFEIVSEGINIQPPM
eukprot:SAG31_NODE_838_length_11617_cov_36.512936_9_plen_64_part_00